VAGLRILHRQTEVEKHVVRLVGKKRAELIDRGHGRLHLLMKRPLGAVRTRGDAEETFVEPDDAAAYGR